jgi:putative ABC transport system permease protein
MFKNHIKIILRNFLRHKGFTAINLGGLSVGLAACLLIGLYVRDELAYDRFHEKGSRIYRLGRGSVGWPYGRLIESEYPEEVEEVVYMRSYPTFSIEHDNFHYFENMLYADDGFFRLFDFPFLEGDPETALEEPNSIVLSDKLARKLFGENQALNQMLLLGEDSLQCTVKGVISVPRRSHIQFDALLSFETLRVLDPSWFEEEMANGWLDLNVVNYVLMHEGADVEALASKVRDLPQKHAGIYLERWGSSYKLDLEPFNHVYLRSDYGNMLGPKSDISYVYLLISVGLFLLFIACVNFVNLSTARSMERAKEVGLRKVVGSTRWALVRQFLAESLLMCLLALLLAFGLTVAFLPYFNSLAVKMFTVRDLLNPHTAGMIFALVIGVGLLAGIYPALSLSSFRPVESLKGRFMTGRHGVLLRKSLVVFQFALSGILIIGTFVMLSQIRYMQKQDLGFDSDQVIVLDARRAPSQELSSRIDAFKHNLAAHPAVQHVSSAGAVPGRNGWRGQISFPEGWAKNKSISLEYIPVDYDFIKTIGLNIVAGRDFDPSFSTDDETAVIINEAAAAVVGWESPQAAIGKGFTSPGSGKPDGRVIGVVEDYHQHGLREEIGPMMFGVRSYSPLFAMRFNAAETASVIAHIKETWTQFFEGYPFDFFFLDEEFAREYGQEQRLMCIFGTFTILTILIASLGLFGLSAFSLQQRTKEIGVRKMLGASMIDIAALLSKDFLKLVFFAFMVAVPVAYFTMQRWLQNYAYRTEIRVEIFLSGAVLMMAVAVSTIGYQAIKAALTDPVQSLRYE